MATYIEDNLPTPADYILYVGIQEANEQTEPDNVSATVPNQAKIEQAIELAKGEILATYCITCPAGKLYISKLLNSLVLDITRYRLDIIKRREDVKEAYQKACDLLERAASDEVCSLDISAEEAEEFGIPYGPTISFSSEPRVWTRKKLRCFKNQSYLTGNTRRSERNKFTKD